MKRYIISIIVFLFIATDSAVQMSAQDLKPSALEEIVRGDMPKILGKTDIKGSRTFNDLLDSDVIRLATAIFTSAEKNESRRRQKDSNERQDKEFLKKLVQFICDENNNKYRLDYETVDEADVPYVLEVCYELILKPFGIPIGQKIEREEDKNGKLVGWTPPAKEVWEQFERKINEVSFDKLELKQDWFDLMRKFINDAESLNDVIIKLEKEQYLETVKKYKTEGTYPDDIKKLSALLNDYKSALSDK